MMFLRLAVDERGHKLMIMLSIKVLRFALIRQRGAALHRHFFIESAEIPQGHSERNRGNCDTYFIYNRIWKSNTIFWYNAYEISILLDIERLILHAVCLHFMQARKSPCLAGTLLYKTGIYFFLPCKRFL